MPDHNWASQGIFSPASVAFPEAHPETRMLCRASDRSSRWGKPVGGGSKGKSCTGPVPPRGVREESALQPDPAGRLQKESVLTGCSGFHSPRSVSQLPGTSGLQAKWRQCRGLSSEKGGWICSQEGKQKPWEKGADPEGALLGLLRIILCPAQLYLYFTLNSSHHRDEFLRENFEEEG